MAAPTGTILGNDMEMPPTTATDHELVAQSEWFDAEWYLQQYQEAAGVDVDLVAHYLTEGAALGLAPSPNFSSTRYLTAHLDVALSGMNPLVHFLRHGAAEGRTVFEATVVLEATGHQGAARHFRNLEADRRVLVVGHLAGGRLFGAERSLLDVLDGFTAVGIDVVMLAPATDNESYLDELRTRCSALVSMPVPHRHPCEEPDEQVVQQVMAVIERFDVHAVHTNTIVPREALVAARRCGIPAVVHAREIPYDDSDLCDWLQATAEELVASVIAEADYLIANSYATATAYPMVGRTAVVPNIADVEKFPCAHPHAGQVRVALVGSGHEKKGRHEFFELARRFEQRDDCEFVMVGPTPAQQQAWATTDRIPRNVRFAGYISTPAAAMAEADIVLNLSRCHEAAPRTVLEAMASGLPVVAWARGGVVEQVVDGSTGYLLPFDDLTVLAHHVDQLVRSPAARVTLGRAGRQLVAARFGPTQLARSLASAYRGILPSAPARLAAAGDFAVPLPLENRTSLAEPFYVGNRSRFASASGMRFVDEHTLVAASMLGQRLFTIEVDPDGRTSRVVAEAATTSAALAASVNLIDLTDYDEVVTADCEHSTMSRYHLVGGHPEWLATHPVAAAGGGYCHGIAAVPSHPHLFAATITTVHPGVHFVDLAGSTAVPAAWAEHGWLPFSVTFIGDELMVVASSSRNAGRQTFDEYRTKITLVRLDLTGGSHRLVHELTLDGGETADGCDSHGSLLYVANQAHDSVMVFDTSADRVRRLPDLEGFSFPHDVTVSPSGRWLAVANYGDSTIRLRRLDD